MTRPTVEVLRLLLSVPKDDPLWGARISELADLGKSTVSQILTRLAELGWVTLREEEGPHPGRPARVFHAISPQGRRQAEMALAARDARGRRRTDNPVPTEAPTPPSRQPTRHMRDRNGDQRATIEQATLHAPGAQHTTPEPDTPPAQPAPKMAGHWPIRFPSPDTLRRSATAPSPEAPIDERATARAGADLRVRGAGNVPEHLAALTEALTTLNVVNQSLTRDVFARAAAEPTHALQYEKLVRSIIMQSSDLRRRTQRAPHARPGSKDDG
ncbi:winged helix DNA-binding protein [Streptoverticillium reticulum]|uniref:winged helix DNA-binding protein n=1 Tax=Streptoverticillium reticulum TaxID=1433415 RepID=UPI0039BFF851